MMAHVYSHYLPSDPESKRRYRVAQMTWSNQRWVERPVTDAELKRHWHEEGKALPYLKDLINAGSVGLVDEDIIVFTNADIMMRSDCSVVIATTLQGTDACYSYRRDFHHPLHEPVSDADFTKGMPYPGSDLAAFRVGWWKAHGHRYPDMIFGLEATDPVMRTLIDKTNAGHNNHIGDVIAHERHGSWWESPENRYRLKGQLVNLALAKAFLRSNNIDPRSHGIP